MSFQTFIGGNLKTKILKLLLTGLMTWVSFSHAQPHLGARKTKHPPVIYRCSYHDTASTMLACAIYAEARSEGPIGMFLVGSVILNRKHNPHYPSSIKKVILQHKQFSYIDTNKKLLRKRFINTIYEPASWKQAQKIAKLLILLDKDQKLQDWIFPGMGAIMYHARTSKPYWAKNYHKLFSYKNHVFYGELASQKDDKNVAQN